MKEVIISTEAVNCYGTRIKTDGIATEQYEKNPVLLWMHRRGYEGDSMPIGRIENLRRDGGRLIGTPVFDQEDDFAKKVERKWEAGYLKAASAGLEILETSDDPGMILAGQTRETVIRCKLVEVSIVDIGGNDEALQLMGAEKKPLRLAAGEESASVPLLKLSAPKEEGEKPEEKNETKNKPKTEKKMKEEILTELGLKKEASEDDALAAVKLLKEQAKEAESLRLGAVESAVDKAIAEKRILASEKEHYVNLGRKAGAEMLTQTLALLKPQQKPMEVVNPGKESAAGAGSAKGWAKLSEVPQGEMLKLRKEQPGEYARLYEAEYGAKCPNLEEEK